jgi:hypothetical protein
MITIMIVFMNGRAGERRAHDFVRVDECTNAFGWRSGLKLWTCTKYAEVYWNLGFGIRDFGTTVTV